MLCMAETPIGPLAMQSVGVLQRKMLATLADGKGCDLEMDRSAQKMCGVVPDVQ